MRVFRWAAAALIVVYLIVSPAIIRRGLARDLYRDWLTPAAPAWQGRIELWHIAGFKVYKGSVTHYLEERALAYGKAHDGVHIEVIGMTPAQYESRVARGAAPDAYSFPSGLVYAEQLREIEADTPAFLGNLGAARTGKQTLALPWLMSGYFLAANTQLLAKYRLELPESADAGFLQGVLSSDADAPQLTMPAVLAARAGLAGTLAEESAFQKGNAALAAIDARTLGELVRTGGLPLAYQPYPSYTELVQYIGASRSADTQRARIVADFAAFLLSDAEQERLCTLGALPVTASAAPVFAEPEPQALYEAMRAPLVPEPFAYQRHKEALALEAAAALSGDEHAKKSFSERMAVVESGEL